MKHLLATVVGCKTSAESLLLDVYGEQMVQTGLMDATLAHAPCTVALERQRYTNHLSRSSIMPSLDGVMRLEDGGVRTTNPTDTIIFYTVCTPLH